MNQQVHRDYRHLFSKRQPLGWLFGVGQVETIVGKAGQAVAGVGEVETIVGWICQTVVGMG
jgi:hypothetical protein